MHGIGMSDDHGKDPLRLFGGGYPMPMILNPKLIQRQRIGPDEIAALYETHERKAKLFQRMCDAATVNLLGLAKLFDDLEYEQQGLWRFPRDPKFHQWFDVPRCTCDKHFAICALGETSLRVFRKGCPVHDALIDWDRREPNTIDLLDERVIDIADPNMESVLLFQPRRGFV
jgi:hypothetical protein